MDRSGVAARAAGLALTLLIALGLKAHYSTASADRLAWIMRPTAGLVELCTGLRFVHEGGAGYANLEHRVVIAKGCAGVNFMIGAFTLIAATLVVHLAPGWRSLFVVGPALAAAYASTVLVNGIRIVIAVGHAGKPGGFAWLTPEQLHRVEGIAVYFAALTALALASRAVARAWGASSPAEDRRTIGRAEGPSLRKVFLVTLGWYLAMTLGVPLLNGALREDPTRFAEHALWVVGVSLCLGGFCLLASRCWQLMRRTRLVDSYNRFVRHPLGETR